MVVTSKSGEQYNVLIWTAPLRNAAGEITHVMEMSTNITQIRQLQDHLSSLGLKISSISHGIKSLLTGLDGGMYLVDSGFAKEDPERVKEGWQDVKTVVSRIRKLVQDILFFAKERELDRKRIDVLSFASEVASAVEPKIKPEGVQFVCDFDESIGNVEIDSSAVRLALISVLENALDACIEDNADKSHKIVFAAKQKENDVIFEVTDNGVGMDRETKESLFTLFFSSKGNKGTGLGLFIANKIIDQHGGKITVASTSGQGSHFRIILPKTNPNAVDSLQD
jgi:signal transduction histidine kinase